MQITIVGRGRAGTALSRALSSVGHVTALVAHDDLDQVIDVDAVVLCVPDDALAEVASSLRVGHSTVVLHIAGSRTLDVLQPHPLVGSMHPLVALSSTEIGARRLIGAAYCVAGHRRAAEIVRSLGGTTFSLPDEQRAGYHAAACVAANHLVTLLGHVAVLANHVGLTLDDFLPLAASALEDVTAMGPAAALTGPASRGDLSTIDAHLAAIPESERATYVALANAALQLAEQRRATTSS